MKDEASAYKRLHKNPLAMTNLLTVPKFAKARLDLGFPGGSPEKLSAGHVAGFRREEKWREKEKEASRR